MNTHYEKLGRRLKVIVPKYRSRPVSHSEDISENVYSTELKPVKGRGQGRDWVGPELGVRVGTGSGLNRMSERGLSLRKGRAVN